MQVRWLWRFHEVVKADTRRRRFFFIMNLLCSNSPNHTLLHQTSHRDDLTLIRNLIPFLSQWQSPFCLFWTVAIENIRLKCQKGLYNTQPFPLKSGKMVNLISSLWHVSCGLENVSKVAPEKNGVLVFWPLHEIDHSKTLTCICWLDVSLVRN